MRSVHLLPCLLGVFVAAAVAEDPAPSPTFADVRISELDRWSEGVPLPDDTEASELAYDTTQTLSLIATSLLVRGDRGGMDSSAATIAGAALADGLDDIRSLLEQMGDASISEADREAARVAIRLFLREARQQLATLSVPNPDRLDEQLEELFAPLIEAVESLTGDALQQGWWPADRVEQAESMSIRFERFLSEVDWLKTRARQRVLERIELVAAGAEQDAAIEALFRIAGSIQAIRNQPGGRTLASNLGRRFEQMALFTERGLPPAPALIEVARVVDRMVVFRAMEVPDTLPRTSRKLYATFGRTYQEHERNMLEQLPVLLASSSPRTDPGLVAAIRAQSQPLERMRLIVDSADWAGAFGAIDASIGSGMNRRLVVLHRALGAADGAEQAMEELESIRKSLLLLQTLPGEASLSEQDPVRDALLAGTSTALSEDLVRLRHSLATDVVEGGPTDESMSPLLLHRRLLELVMRTLAIRLDDASILGFEGWPGWYGRAGMLEDRRDRLEARVRIASTALREQEPDVARRQLDRAEEDLAFMELFRAVAQRRPDVRDGGGAAQQALGRLAGAPGPDAWMLEHRQWFAQMARCLLERDAALADGRIDDADSFEGQAMSIVRTLRPRLEPR